MLNPPRKALREIILGKIRSGEYEPGQRIDRQQVAEEMEVSISRVNFVIQDMVKEGYFRSAGRGGTYVTRKTPPPPVALEDLLSQVSRMRYVLAQRIRSGECPAGYELHASTVAKEFNVRVDIAYTAFDYLKKEGLVKAERWRGVVVQNSSKWVTRERKT